LRHVIIGNSAAGIACIEAIRSKDKKSEITVISEEDYRIYSRCLLSYLVAGDIKDDGLLYRGDDFYTASGVEPILGCRCEKVLPEEKVLKIKGKSDLKFDRLLIATGARPNFPDIKGIDKKGVFGLRTIDDARRIMKRLKDTKTIAILGGGLIGLKSAYGLSTHNKEIRVIVKSNQVLSQILDKSAASIFQNWIEARGIRIMTGLEAKEVLGKDNVEGVAMDDGKTLECEMVVVGKGVEPNVDIVRTSGIEVADGILVDERLRTNFDCIYAAGDVAQGADRVTGESKINALWTVAVEEGRVAGLNMAGEKAVYDGSMAMNSVEFFGLPVVAMGVTKPKGEGFRELVREERERNIYKKVVLKDNLVMGVIFVNDIKSAGVLGGLMRNKIDVSGIEEALVEENFDFAKVAPLIKANRDKFKAEEFKDIILAYPAS
jgi:NAD(P)H-nitrite reductase large subunit